MRHRAWFRFLVDQALDCLIGTVAAEHAALLWTLDRALLKAQPVLGFERYE